MYRSPQTFSVETYHCNALIGIAVLLYTTVIGAYPPAKWRCSGPASGQRRFPLHQAAFLADQHRYLPKIGRQRDGGQPAGQRQQPVAQVGGSTERICILLPTSDIRDLIY